MEHHEYAVAVHTPRIYRPAAQHDRLDMGRKSVEVAFERAGRDLAQRERLAEAAEKCGLNNKRASEDRDGEQYRAVVCDAERAVAMEQAAEAVNAGHSTRGIVLATFSVADSGDGADGG